MKLIRFGEPGKEKPGVHMDDATAVDVSSYFRDYDEEFFAQGGLVALQKWLQGHAESVSRVSLSGVRLGPPISRPSKIICIGLNFRDHAKESKMEVPREPVLFLKATTSLVGRTIAFAFLGAAKNWTGKWNWRW
jgi:2,4-didehydro-3-deoxy-L-rhamnonate hydrolase